MHPLYWAAVAAGVLACAWLIRRVVSSTRRLNQRIAELKEEEANRTGPPEDPYMALARLYAEDAAQRQRPRRRHE
jgi:hypothetical protein